MQCPECRSENTDTCELCHECGARLAVPCDRCGTLIFTGGRFCSRCGLRMAFLDGRQWGATNRESERKHVTVLFADVSGYTTIAEKLDPEDLKDVMGHVFAEIVKVISKYEGVVEKFAGDAVMALFGAPRSHEDDPVRAIKAAREIHRVMGQANRDMGSRIGHPLSVHVGINTGLVVTGAIVLDQGTQGVAGDTINIASRLCSLARAGETLVGHKTCSQAEGFFEFERLEPVRVKGRSEPVAAHRLLSPRDLPAKAHRLSGLRSPLIGRAEPMDQLSKAAERLLKGNGTVLSVCGDAGTGKSRLIGEFRATLDLDAIQWRDGNSYPYSQNIPYYPLIDLLSRAFHIEESDPPSVIKEKAEVRIKALVGEAEGIVPYLGGLLSINYVEVEEVSPEAWRSRLRTAGETVLSALARRAPTIMCFEDLHWADPSSLELLKSIVSETRYPALFICAYRPPLNLFSNQQLDAMGSSYREIKLQDLSTSETHEMVCSILGVSEIPSELSRFIEEKVGGNPFFLEEVINSLIESELLIHENGQWLFAGRTGKIDLPATVSGVISGRLDRLDSATKLLLQEASVIGKTFHYDVLRRITALKDPMPHLRKLEELDLVRTWSSFPDLQYSFKHALTQEAVYNGLLIKQRRDIHERIGLAMEHIFSARLSEHWETLAFHFKLGRSMSKALHYLVKSGEKSLRRYALGESHQYYNGAFELLAGKNDRSKEEDAMLVDLLIAWSLVFYYQGRFRNLTELLKAHEDMVESLEDKVKKGMFHAWLGFAIFGLGEDLGESYRYLRKALELGEETGNRQVIAYACAFFIKTCAEMGLLNEAEDFESKTRQLIEFFPSDDFLYMHYLSGMGYIGWFTGNRSKLYESGRGLIDYGREKSNTRLQMAGSLLMGVYHMVSSDMASAIACPLAVLQTSEDPYHAQFARVLLGMFYVHLRRYEDAEDLLREVIRFSDSLGTKYLKTFASLFLGVSLVGRGRMKTGVRMIRASGREFLRFQRNIFYGLSQFILGNIYLQLLQPSAPRNLSLIAANLGFLLTNRPFAGRKAQAHFFEAIKIARRTGAKGFLGQPFLQMGFLHRSKGRMRKARECIAAAIKVFEQCGCEAAAQKAREELNGLGME